MDDELMSLEEINQLRTKWCFENWTIGEVNHITKTAAAAHKLKERVEDLQEEVARLHRSKMRFGDEAIATTLKSMDGAKRASND